MHRRNVPRSRRAPARSVPLLPFACRLTFLLFGAALLGCSSTSPQRSAGTPLSRSVQAVESRPWGAPDEVIAEVNGKPLTRGAFYLRVLDRFGTAKLLSGILKEELFLQEAARLGLRVGPEEVRAKVDESLEGMAREAGGQKQLADIYEREGLSLADLRRDMEREVSTQIVIAKVTKALRKVDDDALRQYYRETYARTRYRTRHVAYGFAPRPGDSEGEANRRKLEAFNKAVRAADRARKGADFTALARAESEDQVTAPAGGDLGFLHEESPMDPTLRKAILELPEGGVSDPVENPAGGYHVFQVVQIVPSKSYVDCVETLRQEIRDREPDLEEIESALQILRDRGRVRVIGDPVPSGSSQGAGTKAPAGPQG